MEKFKMYIVIFLFMKSNESEQGVYTYMKREPGTAMEEGIQ